MPSPYEHFEDLVRRILVLNHFSITPFPPGRDRGFDFLGTLGSDTWAIEVKFYRTQRAQATLIETAALRLNHRGVTAQATKGMLVVSCYLPIQLRLQLEKDFNLTFIDGADLANWAASDPALLSELQSLLETSPDDLSQVRSSQHPPVLSGKPLTEASLPENTEGSDLCKELRKLGRGKKHWPTYEKLCERILRYLFPNDLHGWHRQKRTDDGLNRYDFVCRIRTTTDFWQFVAQHLDIHQRDNGGPPICCIGFSIDHPAEPYIRFYYLDSLRNRLLRRHWQIAENAKAEFKMKRDRAYDQRGNSQIFSSSVRWTSRG